jgi:UTP-glucose-1-phosphate uridylyltransferase
MEFIEVKSVEEYNYNGNVYDLGVETDHTYTINDYSVHNSSAGSLVNYLLHITEVDPIKYDLLFERLNLLY